MYLTNCTTRLSPLPALGAARLSRWPPCLTGGFLPMGRIQVILTSPGALGFRPPWETPVLALTGNLASDAAPVLTATRR